MSAYKTQSYFGTFGGMFVPEILISPLTELADKWNALKKDPDFLAQLQNLLQAYAGRPTPVTEAINFSKAVNGPRIFLKREDLLHTGAHKINNSLGQCLLAKKMGKQRVIAETGAGQHGVATATACAHLGLACTVYMGALDMERQSQNVQRMKLLGAEVIQVTSGQATLKEAVSEALRDYAASFESSHYCLGSALGPFPYPEIVETFQRVIGEEVKDYFQKKFQALPDMIVACVGGGSNAIGIFSPFIEEEQVKLIGVEAGGTSQNIGEHAAKFYGGKPGVLHGFYSYVLQDSSGNISKTHSISAGLDYPAVGPHHAHLHEKGRAKYVFAGDKQAIHAMQLLSQTEGIIPALESSHALAYLVEIAAKLPKEAKVVVNLSGRGDKDLDTLFKIKESK